MSNFNLDNFLANYKPAKLDFSPYLKCDKLKYYKRMTDKNQLKETHTYIKYIKTSDAFENDDYESHIRNGGLLLSGGCVEDGKLVKTSDNSKWTHLQLKKNLPKGEDDDEIEYRIYWIKIINCHIFYKSINNKY
jgi:hypothetical protein